MRIGRLPNRDVALYTAAIVGPGRPAVMVVDGDAPLPAADDGSQRIEAGGLSAEQHCESPLERFRVRMSGPGEAFDDESAPLRGEPGRPVEVELDLTWETDGTPYQWRPATRYEIPCRVSGTVTVDGERIEVSGPGQRDHSWGARDWWATDWMWSAFHLEDGTRTHTVTVPQVEGYGVGYVQNGGEIDEIETATSTAEVADNGLIDRAEITVGPGRPGARDRAARVRRPPARGAGRPGEPLPARDGAGSRRRRPHRARLDRVEPQPGPGGELSGCRP